MNISQIEWEDAPVENTPELLKRTSKGQISYPYPQIEFFDRKHSIWRSYNKLSPLEIEANIRHVYLPSPELDSILLRLRHGEDCSLLLHNLPKKPKSRKNAIFLFFTCTTIHENLQFLLDIAKKTTSHHKVDRYWYCIEWRKHEPVPSGMHIHICMTLKDPYIDSDSLRKFKQFFKRQCKGRVCDHSTFDISMLKDKIDYMNGITFCPAKNEKKKLDKKIRQKKNIPNIYSNASRKVSESETSF